MKLTGFIGQREDTLIEMKNIFISKIPVNFKFLGPAKAIQWAENAVKKVIQNIDQGVKHCKK